MRSGTAADPPGLFTHNTLRFFPLLNGGLFHPENIVGMCSTVRGERTVCRHRVKSTVSVSLQGENPAELELRVSFQQPDSFFSIFLDLNKQQGPCVRFVLMVLRHLGCIVSIMKHPKNTAAVSPLGRRLMQQILIYLGVTQRNGTGQGRAFDNLISRPLCSVYQC